MSTLVCETITNGTNSVSVEGASNGTANAWVVFSGANPGTLTDSFNVSSITDNGPGDFSVNMTNALPNNRYAVSMSTESSSLSFTLMGKNSNLANRGTSVYRFQCVYHNPTTGVAVNLDGGLHNVVFFASA